MNVTNKPGRPRKEGRTGANKHCSFGKCNSDSRSKHLQGCVFFPFPNGDTLVFFIRFVMILRSTFFERSIVFQIITFQFFKKRSVWLVVFRDIGCNIDQKQHSHPKHFQYKLLPCPIFWNFQILPFYRKFQYFTIM